MNFSCVSLDCINMYDTYLRRFHGNEYEHVIFCQIVYVIDYEAWTQARGMDITRHRSGNTTNPKNIEYEDINSHVLIHVIYMMHIKHLRHVF